MRAGHLEAGPGFEGELLRQLCGYRGQMGLLGDLMSARARTAHGAPPRTVHLPLGALLTLCTVCGTGCLTPSLAALAAQARMPLAYVHFVEVLVDSLIVGARPRTWRTATPCTFPSVHC